MAARKPDLEVLTSASQPQLPQDDNKNLFVKFKHFADAQAGLVLKGMQSIIGLPSSLKPLETTHGVHQRWTDWDEHLKQRDETQVQQRLLKASQTHSSSDSDKTADTPGDNDNDYDNDNDNTSLFHCVLSKEDRAAILSMDDEGESDSLELYMPVTKALFGHLIEELDDRIYNSPFGAFSGHKLPSFMSFLKKDDTMMGHMPIVHAKIFDHLSAAPCPIKKLSTIPYIMFSPYSPLALTFQMPVQSLGSRVQGDSEVFPYAAAFQDLLLVSQGREMRNLEDMAMTNGMHSFWYSWGRGEEERTHDLVGSAMSWLGEMTRVGLLWTRVDSSWFEHQSASTNWKPQAPHFSDDADVEEVINEVISAHQGEASTELDVYDLLLNAVNGKLPSDDEFKSIFTRFEKSMRQVEADIKAAFPFASEEPRSEKSAGTQTDVESVPESIMSQGLGMLSQIRQLIDGPDASSTTEPNADESRQASQILSLVKQAADTARTVQDDDDDDDGSRYESPIKSSSSHSITETLSDGTEMETIISEYTTSDGSITSTTSVRKVHPDGSYETSEKSTTRRSELECPGMMRSAMIDSQRESALECPGMTRAAMMEHNRKDEIDEVNENVAWLRAQLEEVERSQRLSPQRKEKIRRNVEELIESSTRVKEDVEDDNVEEVRGWEAEGRRIKNARDNAERVRREREEEQAAGTRQVRSRGKGWFWE